MKCIRIGIKFWDQAQNDWVTISKDLYPPSSPGDWGDQLVISQVNLTYGKRVDGNHIKSYIDVAQRANSWGDENCTVTNPIYIVVGKDSLGWPFLKIGYADRKTKRPQSVIFDTVSNRERWVNYYNEHSGDRINEILYNQWKTDTGCIQRPSMIATFNMNGHYWSPQTNNPVYYFPNIYIPYPSYYHSLGGFIKDGGDGIMDILECIKNGNKDSGNSTTINIYNNNNHTCSKLSESIWDGNVESSQELINQYDFLNVLSYRFTDTYTKLKSYNPWGNTNRCNNVPGWWFPISSGDTSHFSNMYPWAPSPYKPNSFYADYSNNIDVCTSLFFLNIYTSSNELISYSLPMMGAVDPGFSDIITNELSTNMKFRKSIITSGGLDNTIFPTIGGELIYNIETGQYVPKCSSRNDNIRYGSIGIRAVTYEDNQPVSITETSKDHIIDCLIIPSLFSDWNAIDIYGLGKKNMNPNMWYKHFIWETSFDWNSSNPNSHTSDYADNIGNDYMYLRGTVAH